MPLRALRLAAISLPLAVGFTIAGAAARVGPVGGGCAQASSAHHAALVVEHGDGAVTSVCVAFATTTITGAQLLDLSHVPYATADYGSYGKAVCQVQDEPQSYPPGCWTPSSFYWAMFVSRGGGGWQASSLGISTQTFGDGDAEGFRYESQSDSSTPPSPSGVCPHPVPATRPPTPRATARPSSTPATTPPAPTPRAVAPVTSRTAAPSFSASPTPSLGAVAGISTSAPAPPPRAVSISAAAWTAAAFGTALLCVLAIQVTRLRRAGSSSMTR